MLRRAVEALVPDAGLYPAPDSEQHMRAELERIKPRGKGPDPLATAYPVGRDVVAPLEWRTEQTGGPDVVGNLRQRLLDEARRRRTP